MLTIPSGPCTTYDPFSRVGVERVRNPTGSHSWSPIPDTLPPDAGVPGQTGGHAA